MNEGVSAVIVFYILAGHVIEKLFGKKLKANLGRLKTFYVERFLRIFPLYLYVALLTILFLALTNYGYPVFNITNITLNLLIIPLNYYMYIEKEILVLTGLKPPWWLIPPAWSLGLELQAYILLPFLIKFRKLAFLVFITSLIVYSLANLGIIHSDYWGYRLLPGVIFTFITGVYIERLVSKTIKRYELILLIFTYFFALFWFVYFVLLKHKYGAYTRETLIGILLGVPAVLIFRVLSKKIRLPANQFFADLSYGIFLSHFLSIWILNYLEVPRSVQFYEVLLILLSVALVLPGIRYIEKPIERFRFKLYDSV